MKLLKRKKSGLERPAWTHDPAMVYLVKLGEMLRHDLTTLASTSGTDEWIRQSRILKVFTGNLDEHANPERDGTNYLFLNVPSSPGYLLELNSTNRQLEMRKATLIVPIKRNSREELESSTLFVTQPRVLESYEVLNSDLIRRHQPLKTFPVEAMSEHLLSLALGISESETEDLEEPKN